MTSLELGSSSWDRFLDAGIWIADSVPQEENSMHESSEDGCRGSLATRCLAPCNALVKYLTAFEKLPSFRKAAPALLSFSTVMVTAMLVD